MPHSKSVYDMPRSSSYFLSFIFIIPSWHILRHFKLMWEMFELNSFCCSNTIHESGEKLVHEICKNKVNLSSVIWWDKQCHLSRANSASPYINKLYVMCCAIWYHLCNLKNALVCNFTKSNIHPRIFFTLFKLHKCYQIAQPIIYEGTIIFHTNWHYLKKYLMYWKVTCKNSIANFSSWGGFLPY